MYQSTLSFKHPLSKFNKEFLQNISVPSCSISFPAYAQAKVPRWHYFLAHSVGWNTPLGSCLTSLPSAQLHSCASCRLLCWKIQSAECINRPFPSNIHSGSLTENFSKIFLYLHAASFSCLHRSQSTTVMLFFISLTQLDHSLGLLFDFSSLIEFDNFPTRRWRCDHLLINLGQAGIFLFIFFF